MNTTYGTYQEWGPAEYQVPFCTPYACATNASTSEDAVLWDCLPTVCRHRIEGFAALLFVLSLLTTVFNAVVLAANSLPSTRRLVRRNPTMENYAIYVMSIALADLLVGSVVLPVVLGFFHTELRSESRAAGQEGAFNATQRLGGYDRMEAPGAVNASFTTAADDGSAGRPLGGGSMTVMNAAGVVTHLAIFVSMYTLAAASADRFYTSTKPVSNRSIILSGSSFRRKSRFSASSDGDDSSCLNLKRSTCAVIIIWMCGVLFSMVPLLLPTQFRYRPIGHVYVALVATSSGSSRMLVWYVVALALPLLITWLFSFLICVTLWRRKRRLKRSYSSKSNGAARRSSRKKAQRERFQRQASHVSVTESHMTPSVYDRMLSNESEAVGPDSAKESDSGEEVFAGCRNPPTSLPIRKTFMRQSSSPLPRTRPRRPSSIDLGLIKQLAKEDIGCKRTYSQPTGDAQFFAVTPFTKIDDSFVAKRLLCRRSWGGCPDENVTKSSVDVSARTPKSPTASYQAMIPATQNSSPNLSVKNLDRRADGPRSNRTPTRLRRKSSVFRARELLRSKSLESNIVKTLFAVVVAISVAVLPLLAVITKIALAPPANLSEANAYVSAVVVAMTVLFSNSLWNCLIYGARMPYFRRSIVRMFHKTLRRAKATYCCRQVKNARRTLRRKLRSGSKQQYSPNEQQLGNREEVVSDVFSVARPLNDLQEFNGNYVMKQR